MVISNLFFYVVIELLVGYVEFKQVVQIVLFFKFVGLLEFFEGVYLLLVIGIVDFGFDIEVVNNWLYQVVVLFFSGRDIGKLVWQMIF